jgi:hypothetical protein
MSMTSDQASKAFALRMGLSQAGIPWWPCLPDGRRAGFQTVSESGIRFLIIEHPEATETGIFIDGALTIVDEVPLTPEQVEERRRAEKEARQAALLAEENARQAALVEAARAQERQRKADKRRALGKPTREEWLADHSEKPWVEAGISRRTWFKRRAARVIPP